MKTKVTVGEYTKLLDYCSFMQNDPCREGKHGCVTYGVGWECCGCPEEKAFKEELKSKFSDVLKMLDNKVIKDFCISFSKMLSLVKEREEISKKYEQACDDFIKLKDEKIEVCDD